MASKKFLLAIALLMLCATASAETIFWLRGNDETVYAENALNHAILELPPNEFSTKTTITRTSSGSGTLAPLRWKQ